MRCYLLYGRLGFLFKAAALCCLLTGALVTGCTSLGAPDAAALQRTDFGPPDTLRVCVLLDDNDVSRSEAAELIQTVNQSLSVYNLQITVPWYQHWERPGHGDMKIIENLASLKLPPPCDRLLALVGRDVGDFLIGLLGFEELGSVDTVTHTRGYVFAELESINQIFMPPSAAAVHETHHLLGCAHALTMAGCYERIAMLKNAARLNRQNGNDFFPTYTLQGQLILRREEVAVREAMALRIYQARQKDMSATVKPSTN